MLRLNNIIRLTKTELAVFRHLTDSPHALPKTVAEYRAALLAAVPRLQKADTLLERQAADCALHLLGAIKRSL
jgi:hypothetical protein